MYRVFRSSLRQDNNTQAESNRLWRRFPPLGGARGRSELGLEPWVTAPGRAASRPIPRRKSFTNLTAYARTKHTPSQHLFASEVERGRARIKTSHLQGHTCPKSSYLYTRQAPQYRTPSTPPAASSVLAREMTFFINWTGGLGAKRLHHGSVGQGGTNCTCSGSSESQRRPGTCLPWAAESKEAQSALAAAPTSPPQPLLKLSVGFSPWHLRTTAPGREACKDGPQLAPSCCTCSRTASVEPGSEERGKT